MRKPALLWQTGMVCATLTVLGALLSPGPSDPGSVLINRGLILAAIFGAVILLCRLQDLSERSDERTAALARSVGDLQTQREELKRRGRVMLSIMEDLRIEQDRFKLTIESSPSGMVMIDSRGMIVLANRESGRLFGYRVDELQGKPIEVLIPKRFATAHPALRQAFMASPAARRMGEGRDLYGLRKDGSEFPVEIGLNPLKIGDEVFVLSAILDITERKAAERALSDANDHLEERIGRRTAALVELNKELEGFSYSVSHDLRAPLRHILGFMELLQERSGHLLDDTGRQYADLIMDSGKKMDALLEALLAFSRMGRSGMRKEIVPLAPLIADLVAMHQGSIKDKAVSWNIGSLPDLYGDPTLIRQLFFNLLSNALKFSARNEKTTIAVGSSDSLEEDVVFVRDNGIGFDMKYMDRIFDPFQRLHTDEEYEGSGIGLAFVKRIVVRHGGRVWVESEPGKGATFFVALPKWKVESAPTPSHPATPPPPPRL